MFIVALFSSAPAILLFLNIRDSAGVHNLNLSASHRSTGLNPPTDNYYGVPKVIYPAKASDLCVTFGFLTLNPATPAANFAILVGATKRGMQQLSELSRRGRYKNVSVVVSSNIGLSSIVIPVPLSALDHGQASSCGSGSPSQFELLRNAAFRIDQNIFVIGQPRSFPDDWYELNDSVIACATRLSQDECNTGHNQDMRLPSSLIMMTRDEDMQVRVGTDNSNKNFPFSDPLTFTIRRPWQLVLYTYWVAVLPFVLLIVLGGYQHVRQRKVPKAHEVAFGIAATMVAILPLRAVLVPSSLPNLTRLDIIFRTEVALLVALSIVWVVTWPPTKADTAARKPTPGTIPDEPAGHDEGQTAAPD